MVLLHLAFVVDRLMVPPKKYPVLHDQKDFVDVIKLKILRWEEHPG